MTDASETSEISAEIIDEGPCQKRLKAEVPADSVVREVDSNYKQLMATIQLPGFRKGRVPRSVLERRYADKIEDEVKEELIHSTFEDEMEKRELRILGPPTFDNVEFSVGEPLRYDAVFEIAPAFELPEYKGLAIERRSTAVGGDEVEREIESLREQYATWDDIELGSQQDEDVVVADVALGEGEQASIQREDVYLKIGNDRVDNIQIEGLSDRLRTAGAGDRLEFDVDVPVDFPREDLRGQQVPFGIDVKSAKRRTLPELDDEFLEKIGVDSVDRLRENLLESLETRRRIQEEHRQEEDLIDRLLDGLEMGLPPSVIERKKAELSLGMSYRLMREGRSTDEIDKIVAEDTSIGEDAEKELKQIFLLDRIADQENILVTEDEVAQRIQAIALTYNRDPNEVLEDYMARGELDEVRNGLLREKVRRFIRERAKVAASVGSDSKEGVSSSMDEEQ